MPQDYSSTLIVTDRSKDNRKALLFIFITVCLDLLCAGILISVIPFLVGQFNQDALMVGLLALSFYAAQFVAAPVLGQLSDRYGRRPVLLISVIGTGLAYLLFGFNSLWLLFTARIVDGITGGNISVAEAYIADVSSPEDRAKNFGLLGAAFGLGFIIGPALGGWLSQFSLQAPALIAAILSLSSAIFGFFVLPESLPAEHRFQEKITFSHFNPFNQISQALKRKNLRGFLLANFAQEFAFSGLQTNFVLFSFVQFGLGLQQNGKLFTYIGVIVALMQGFVTRLLLQRFSEQRLTVAGLGLMSAGFVATATAPTADMLYPAMTVLSFGTGIAMPTLMGTISNRVSLQEQGSIMGAMQALSSLAFTAGPIWAGLTFDYLGATAPYWTGAVWLAASCLLAARAI